MHKFLTHHSQNSKQANCQLVDIKRSTSQPLHTLDAILTAAERLAVQVIPQLATESVSSTPQIPYVRQLI